MRERVLAILLVTLIAMAIPARIDAQVATPQPESQLNVLGLPEITMTATDFALRLSRTEVPAGRYLFTLRNDSWDPDLEVFVVKLAVDNLAQDTSCKEGLPPECFNWYGNTDIPGGVSGQSPQAILDLSAGTYGFWGPGELSILPAATLTVTGASHLPVDGADLQTASIVATKTAIGEQLTLTVEGTLAVGPHIVAIVNAADQPIFVNVAQFPPGANKNGAILRPESVDPEQLEAVVSTSPQSSGTRQRLMVNLGSGPAYLACYIRDPISVADVSGWYRVAVEVVSVASS